MNEINNNYQFFKSAVAFFFLFFLHEISFGTRQQGISYNGKALAKNGNLWHFAQ